MINRSFIGRSLILRGEEKFDAIIRQLKKRVLLANVNFGFLHETKDLIRR